MRTVLTLAWAIFVAGGLVSGAGSIRTFVWLSQPQPQSSAPTAVPSPALAPRPPLRDFDQNPPPFAAAGDAHTDPTPQPASPVGRLTVLLLGIDQRPDEAAAANGDPGRTDTMLLVSIDYDAHTAAMVSIPRDGFVVIPGYGSERVNTAYTYGELNQAGGGPDLAKRTVAQLFNIPVDRYALVDIQDMVKVIDTLGGVWIDNPYRLVDTQYPTDNYGTISIDIAPGHQLMDGVTAVEYARTRHPDSDYGREGRQQQVLLAIRDQALQLQTLPRLPQLVPQIVDLVHTDLSPVEIGQLLNFGRTLDRSRDIVTLPPNPDLTPAFMGAGGASYINLTPTYRAVVQEVVTQPRVAAERADIEVLNAGAPVGSGGRAADLLGQAGLPVGQVASAPENVVATRIETGSGAQQSAQAIAQILGIPANALVIDGDSNAIRVLLGPDTRLPTG